MTKEKKHAEINEESSEISKSEAKDVTAINPRRSSRKGLVLIIALIIILPALGIGALFGYQYLYQDKVYEGVSIISRDEHDRTTMKRNLGGMTKQQVVDMVDEINRKYQEEGVVLMVTTASGTRETIPFKLKREIEGNQLEIARLDGNKLADYVLAVGRSANQFSNLRDIVVALFQNAEITTNSILTFNSEIFNDTAHELLRSYENPAQNAQITVTSLSPLEYQVVPEKSGDNFNYEALEKNLKKHVEDFAFNSIAIAPEPTSPSITSPEVSSMASSIPSLLADPITLVYRDSISSSTQSWKLSSEQLSKWLTPHSISSTITFGVNPDQVKSYLQANVSKYIDRQPQSAVFRREGDKVVDFQGSHTGLQTEYMATAEHINDVLLARSRGEKITSTTVVVAETQPTSTVADANDLGITDIIGVGVTTFHDSHTNRIKNIANAVKLLNGTLIKPGEVFSTLDHTKPFTTDNGYLPELVIKGNKIEPELGGGVCQISTTLFRMAMNSAMPITERHPHGLVVNYYADPVNGNPGVDASVYEGSLDFRFTNDTGHHILLQTDIDYTKQQLTFTLWGKPDGRKGSYTRPVVERWIGAGPAQELPDPTLAPGKTVCQNAFSGAVASFTYTRVLPSGEKIDRVFQSTYRAVPKTCRVGVEAASHDPLNSLLDVEPVVDTLAPAN